MTATSTSIGAQNSSHFSDISLDSNETADDLGSERLPPLRELIWRRLRRRSAQIARLEDDNERTDQTGNQAPGSLPGNGSGQIGQTGQFVRTHREGLTRMVDQMRIDQATNTGNPGSTNPQNGGGGIGGSSAGSESNPGPQNLRNIPSGIPGIGSFSLYQHDPYNHASFRAQYVNRIRPDEPPRHSMNFSR